MVSLISRWKLKNGCSDALKDALQGLAAKVKEHEPGTLGYAVHLDAPSLLGTSDNKPIPGPQQKEVVFFEAYRDSKAFHEHVNGTVFTAFLDQWRDQFRIDPKSGWPETETTFLARESAFFRS